MLDGVPQSHGPDHVPGLENERASEQRQGGRGWVRPDKLDCQGGRSGVVLC